MKNYLSEAKKIYQFAESEFLSADGNEYKIRQAAEKGWLSIVQATNFLLEKKGLKIPRGNKKREELILDLEEKYKKVKEFRIRERYRIFQTSLHIDCFYEGDFSIKIIRRDFNKLKEYISDIEKI